MYQSFISVGVIGGWCVCVCARANICVCVYAYGAKREKVKLGRFLQFWMADTKKYPELSVQSPVRRGKAKRKKRVKRN